MQRRHALTLAAAASLAPLATVSRAQGFPSRTVRIVVPATAGSADVFARALAQRRTPVLGQQVIVEQKPGAGTHIGNDHVARSAPDGHTMLINSLPLVTGDALYSKLSYNTARDLRPVILVAEVTNIITVHPSLGVNTLKELVDLARRDPGKLNHGTPGAGSSGHLSGELLNVKAGAQIMHVPYQGNAQATKDHLAGILQVGFVNMPVGIQFVKTGQLKALAVTSAKRTAHLPDVPTVNEALGINDYELTGWFGIMVPSATPADVVTRLNTEIGRILKDPSFVEIVGKAGGDVLGGSAEDFAALMRRDSVRLTEVLRASGTQKVN
jgi:tripartite-type tricarboxylate transporter receptor subunit TctC